VGGLECRGLAVGADEADVLDAGFGDGMLGDKFPCVGASERRGALVDHDVQHLAAMVFTDAVDDVADAHPPCMRTVRRYSLGGSVVQVL